MSPVCGIRIGDISAQPMTPGEGLTWPGSIRTVGKGNKTHVMPLHPDLRELVVSFILANHTDMDPRSFLLSYRRVPALGAEDDRAPHAGVG